MIRIRTPAGSGLECLRVPAQNPLGLLLCHQLRVAEVCRQAGWAETYIDVSHYRTSDGHKVDLVLEAEDGTVAAVEVKASSKVTGADLRGLAQLRDRLGTSFAAGAVLHLGERAYRADDRLWVLPVDRLWI